MKKLILGLVAAVAVAVAGAVAAPGMASADDGSGACATRYEYRQVRNGMTPARVGSIFGTNGRITSSGNYGGYRFVNREYRPCRKYSYVSVSFSADPGQVLTVDGKSGFWL
jgi:hypothetical protein